MYVFTSMYQVKCNDKNSAIVKNFDTKNLQFGYLKSALKNTLR